MTNVTKISLSKGHNYLVYKESTRSDLAIMPGCEHNARFDQESFSCIPCDQGTRSWGLQSTECIPCLRIWFSEFRDDYSKALYDQMCTGDIKSVLLVSIVPFLSVVLALCLCCATRDNGLTDKQRNCCMSSRQTMKPQKKVQAPKGYNRQHTVDSKRKERANSQKSEEKPMTERKLVGQGAIEMGELQQDTERNENN